ncbi:hypothetical protein CMV_003651 [Castanea mollissima]|uniref:Uncharacterized protein n=1 Tax=Castanea mollissima TaxID=60419 RepID=A0A8J4VW19_9ROSI|nr:hypothetical protein CMV_003651 [Castanea mollissima]
MTVTEIEVCLLARIPSFMSLSIAASSFTLASSSSSAISQLNGTSDGRYWMKPIHVEPKRSVLTVPLAATFATPVMIEKVDECPKNDHTDKLAKDLQGASPLEIEKDDRFEKVGDDATVTLSGVEDLTLIEAWLFDAGITGLKEYQSSGTTEGTPVIQVDPSFEGRNGAIGRFLKSNAVADAENQEYWSFLLAINVLFNSIPFHGYNSFGYEKEGMWWWEETDQAKECGLYKAMELDHLTVF